MEKKRVIAWGSGPIGMPGLRGIIDNSTFELVGLHAWSPEKIGRDAGDIAGVGKTGVIATNDVESLRRLEADCLVHNGNYSQREEACLEEVIPFLRSGTNVVAASMMDLVHPKYGRQQFVKPIEAACRAGQTSIFSGGTDPGYMTTGLLFNALSGAGRVDSVSVAEICNLNAYGSFLSTKLWGFNQPLDYRAPMYYDGIGLGWHESTIWGIGDYLGVDIDKIVQTYETAAVDFDYPTGFGTGLANTIAAIRWTVKALAKDGSPLITYMKVERMHKDAAPDWEQPIGEGPEGEAGYHVVVKGDPSFRIDLSLSLYAGCAITALHPINAIHHVCNAPPGIIGQLDLPHFWSRNTKRH